MRNNDNAYIREFLLATYMFRDNELSIKGNGGLFGIDLGGGVYL